MDIAERIGEVCKKSNDAAMGVLAPHACLFCFKCPLSAVVLGVTDQLSVTSAKPIPEDKLPEVNAWLDKIEQRIVNERAKWQTIGKK